MDVLSLHINQQKFEGWKELRVSDSLERGASSFDLQLTDRWPEQQGQNSPRPVHIDEPCFITIGNDRVITGYIDDVLPSFVTNQHSINVKGRSKVGDLIDCSLPRQQIKNQNLLQLAKSQCAPFDINVVAQGDTGAAFKDLVRDAGQPIFEFIEQAARIRAQRLHSSPMGDLVITRAGTARAEVALVLGENIKRGRGVFSGRQRFSEVTVLAQQGDAALGAEAMATPKATVKNELVKNRYRPQVIVSQEPGNKDDCKTRAQWQVNSQQAKSQTVTYTVSGWRQKPAGKLWAINELVHVTDAYCGISAELLIVQRDFVLNEKGAVTELTLAPKAAYELLPIKEKVTDDGGWL